MSTPVLRLTQDELEQTLRILQKSRRRVANREVSYICHSLPYSTLGSKLRRAVMASLSLPTSVKGETWDYRTFEMYYRVGLNLTIDQPQIHALRLQFLDDWIKVIKKALRS